METLLKNLRTAIFEVLEKMYFLVPDAEEDTASFSADEDSLCSIYIGLKGNPNYLLTFVFDKRLAKIMTVDILGIDESELNNDIIQRNLKETANIIAGKFLLSFEGQDNRNISLPHNRKEEIFGKYEPGESCKLSLSFNGYGVNSYIETVWD